MKEKNPWKLVDRRVVYSNRWITVREDNVIRPDGQPGIYGVVETPIATGVLAVTPRNELYLVGQYRYPVDEYSWEIVEGGCEPGEDPGDTIVRELREEAGLVPARIERLGGEVHLSNCLTAERGYLFFARDLTEVPSEPEGTEVLQVRRVPFRDCFAMVTRGEIKDSLTIMGILLAAHKYPWLMGDRGE